METGALNQAVKRNQARFPADFMFPLTAAEAAGLKAELGGQWGGRRRSRPFAFTQEGIAMLSSVLHSHRAIQMNIVIMRAFVQMRELVAANEQLIRRVEKLESGQHRNASAMEVLVEDIERLAGEIALLVSPLPGKSKRIGFPSGRE